LCGGKRKKGTGEKRRKKEGESDVIERRENGHTEV
jgi:hypothetical protein